MFSSMVVEEVLLSGLDNFSKNVKRKCAGGIDIFINVGMPSYSSQHVQLP